MARCTAPVNGHRTASAEEACPECRGRSRYSSYSNHGRDRILLQPVELLPNPASADHLAVA